MSIYNFNVKDEFGKTFSLNDYKGKVLLIVNTALECGFARQYEELEKLYRHHKDEGFEILDFPSNQFGGQSPLGDGEISKTCHLRYDTTFPQLAKIDVNGVHEDPLYTYLKKEKTGILTPDIKWNFTKFLIDRDGNVIERYASNTRPLTIEKDIEALL